MTQALLNGFISGTAIALVALSFQIVYLPTRVFFVALAAVYSLAPYVARLAHSNGLNGVMVLLVTCAIGALISMLCEWTVHAMLEQRHSADVAHVVASLGIYIVLVQVISIVWGSDTKRLSALIVPATAIGNIAITYSQSVTLISSSVLLMIVTITLRYTTIGVRLRALADNPTMFALFGHDVRHYRLVAFAFAGGVASASALASAYDVGFTPHGGLHAILLAIVAVIIGGRSSFVGPVVGALVVGAVRALVCYSAAQWQDGATFALLALFLLLRPRGILARVTRVEATS